MFWLCDIDIILKLAAFNLLDDAFLALDAKKDELYVSSTARFVLERLAEQLGPDVSTRVNGFLPGAKLIDWELPAAEQLLFEDTLGIDAGEAILFSATARLADFILITGDKTSLTALARSPGCRHIAERLAGRVVCLEQIIQRCISHCGFASIKDRIVPARDCDKSLSAIFGSGLTATEEGVREGLISYVGHLRASTGLLLVS